jgi:predicted dienelactone hydrolase
MWSLTVLLACGAPEGVDADGSPSLDSAAAPDVDPVAHVTGNGAYRVGYRSSEVVYDHPLTGERRLRLALWFPTEAPEPTETEVSYLGFFPAPGVLDDPAPTPGPHPVIVFSHGHRGFAESLGAVMAQAARHGWIVAAPDHTGNTSFDSPDRTTDIYVQRPADVSATLSHLLDGAEPFLVPNGQAVVAGHSFGGFTALLIAGAGLDVATWGPLCAQGDTASVCNGWKDAYTPMFAAGFADQRFQGAVAFAPGDWRLMQAEGVAATSLPTLHQTGALDPSTPLDGEAIWGSLPAPAWRYDLAGAGHVGWGDQAGLPGIDSPGVTLDPQTSQRIGAIGLLALAETATGRGDASALLDGREPVDDAVTTYVRPTP